MGFSTGIMNNIMIIQDKTNDTFKGTKLVVTQIYKKDYKMGVTSSLCVNAE